MEYVISGCNIKAPKTIFEYTKLDYNLGHREHRLARKYCTDCVWVGRAYIRMKNHQFSIIIIAFNNRPELQLTLHSLNALTYPRDHFEVIVVDDGSNPNLESLLDGAYNYKVQFHYVPRTDCSCRSKARNQGAELASYDTLVFIDGDQYVGRTLLAVYDEYMSINPSSPVLLGTRIDLSQWQSQSLVDSNNITGVEKVIRQKKDIRIRMNEAFGQNLMKMSGAWTLFWSHNFVIKKQLFENIGRFDESFILWGFEDVELGYRLKKNNHNFDIVENNVLNLFHDQKYTEDKHYGWLKNLAHFYQKYNDISIMHQLAFYESFNVEDADMDAEFKSVQKGFSRFSGKVGFVEKMDDLLASN